MTIKQAIFTVETVAHLQGQERSLLPIVESARAELTLIEAALANVVKALQDVPLDVEGMTAVAQAEATLALLRRAAK